MALAGIASVVIGLTGYFGVISGMNAPLAWGLVGAGGLLLVSAALLGVVMRKGENPNRPIRVLNWNVGTQHDRFIATYYAAIGHHPESQHLDVQNADEELVSDIGRRVPHENRRGMIQTYLREMGHLDILCLQETFEFGDPLALLPDSQGYEASSEKKPNNTRIIWNTQRFELFEEYDIGQDSCVVLREIKTDRNIVVVSAHIDGFSLEAADTRDMSVGNAQLSSILTDLSEVEAPLLIGGDFNCPRLYDEEYNAFTNRQADAYHSRHNLLVDQGFQTLPPDYPTNINRHFGQVKMDYLYLRPAAGTEPRVGVAELPERLKPDSERRDWQHSPSDHKPVIQEFTF